MKKIALLLVAALVLCAVAAAETVEMPDYALTLPEGFAAVSEAEMEGYREASARDAGGRYEGEALMALRDGEAITVVEGSTDPAGTRAAAEARRSRSARRAPGTSGTGCPNGWTFAARVSVRWTSTPPCTAPTASAALRAASTSPASEVSFVWT